jgi:hypothetical protein
MPGFASSREERKGSPSMTSSRDDTFFHSWASTRLGISAEEVSLAALEDLLELIDLPEGPGSEMGGEVGSVLDSYTESELLELAALGDELLKELPPLPEGYRPPAKPPIPTRC